MVGLEKCVVDDEFKDVNKSETQYDNWGHRSFGMRCKFCMWFVPKYSSAPLHAEQEHLGRCRRHSPTMSGYPAVFEKDWCGDHKLDENKR